MRYHDTHTPTCITSHYYYVTCEYRYSEPHFGSEPHYGNEPYCSNYIDGHVPLHIWLYTHYRWAMRIGHIYITLFYIIMLFNNYIITIISCRYGISIQYIIIMYNLLYI